MAALAYIIGLIVPLIILLTDSKNRAYQRYHAIQSLGLSAAIFVAFIVLCIVVMSSSSSRCSDRSSAA